MSYVQKILPDSEKIVYKAKVHWIIFLPTIIWMGISLLLCLAYGFCQSLGKEEAPAILLFALLTCLITFCCFIKELLVKHSSEYVLTSKRLIFKTGIIARKTKEIVLTKYEGLSVNQGIMGRILGYGQITATSGGITNEYNNIKDPTTFILHINEQMAQIQNS